MVRRFALALIFTVAFAGIAQNASAVSCTAAQIAAGSCSVGGGTTGSGVDLWGDATWGGSSGSGNSDGQDECPVVVNEQCVGSSPPKDGVGPTTTRDIESFRPRSPQQFVEPGGWTLRRVPTNFWSTAVTHIVSGRLLDNPADVRFTPVRYRRYFGDRSRQTTDRRGATWSELGQSPWTKTSTSHTYDESGDFRIRLVVWYAAEFRFGSQNWRLLDGLVAARANDLNLAVFSTDTVLVDRPCSRGGFDCGLY